ncbi:hypothetical protein JTE90_000150 [Oedothorax gibbosus]|uniref:Neurotransmitter-gated ion-channel ligand-binding domain-containing protein n=1 Tax=Oedothorax gibbosus TaxID=931172 RepID=A0AAV6U5S7_9ARAC|nr:hypothetical protein JTE90_000150 [Oedothorax gibbosus]
MNLFAVLGCLLLSWTDALVIENSNLKTERDLKRDLFENYDKQVRPIKDPHAAMELQVSLSPIMIRDVDVKHQSLALDSWMLMKWHDDYLTWDPEVYNDIKILRVPSTEIWKPDLALYSASSAENLFPMAITQALLYFNGTVLWVPMQTLNSRCPFFKQADKSYFDCNIKMGSWTYSAKEVNPQLLGSGLDVSNFYDINPDWKGDPKKNILLVTRLYYKDSVDSLILAKKMDF